MSANTDLLGRLLNDLRQQLDELKSVIEDNEVIRVVETSNGAFFDENSTPEESITNPYFQSHANLTGQVDKWEQGCRQKISNVDQPKNIALMTAINSSYKELYDSVRTKITEVKDGE